MIAACVAGAGCSGASVAGDGGGLAPLVGEWRGVLLSGGGDLPFALVVRRDGETPLAVVLNAGVETPFDSVTRQGAASYTLRFAGVQSELGARMSPSGDELSGFWRHRLPVADGAADERLLQLPFSVTKGDRRRFQRNDPDLLIAPEGAMALPDLSGRWQIALEGSSSRPAIRALAQDGERVEGPALPVATAPETSGLRLEGIYRNGLLRLSLFDGSRAWLVHARAHTDGTLHGTAWMGGDAAVAWRATRAESP